jgi:hypothetical protein
MKGNAVVTFIVVTRDPHGDSALPNEQDFDVLASLARGSLSRRTYLMKTITLPFVVCGLGLLAARGRRMKSVRTTTEQHVALNAREMKWMDGPAFPPPVKPVNPADDSKAKK